MNLARLVVRPAAIPRALLAEASAPQRAPRHWLAALASAALVAGFALQVLGAPLPWDAALIIAAMPAVITVYPDGRFDPFWLVVPVLGYVGAAVVYAATGGAVAREPWWNVCMPLAFLLLIPAIRRYRRRLSIEERERVRWGIFGFGLGNGVMLLLVALTVANGRESIDQLGPWAAVVASIALLSIPGGFVVGLVRPRLFDVDGALRNLAFIAMATALLAPVYGGVSLAAMGAGASDAAPGWLGAAAVALLAYPVIRLSGRAAERLVYSRARSPIEALSGLGRRFGDPSEPTTFAQGFTELLTEAIGTAGVELTGPGLDLTSTGRVDESDEAFSVIYGGEQVATLRVAPRPAESSLTARDRTLVDLLATHAAPAIHGMRVIAELTDARSRLVRAGEEDRKRLRRDLHDDLAPTLAGLGLAAAAIVEMAKVRDAQIASVARSLLVDIQAALAQTREISHGLRPPVLDDRGLIAAIRDRVLAGGVGELIIEIDAPAGHLSLPAAVEIAVLRIVQEAVLNVRKHADADHCWIGLSLQGHSVHVQIADDGRGLPTRPGMGLGLLSIHERAAELGGAASVRRRGIGGTLVDVVIPLTDDGAGPA